MNEKDLNLKNREQLLSRLRAEIVGPDPAGDAVDLFEGQGMTWEEFRKAKTQLGGEEIVWQDPPTKRYGAGILYPREADEQTVSNATESEVQELASEASVATEVELSGADRIAERPTSSGMGADEAEDEGVALTNSFRPSALGLSFLADLGTESEGITLELVSIGRTGRSTTEERPCGLYRPLTLKLGDASSDAPFQKKVWLRVPVVNLDKSVPSVTISSQELLSARGPIARPVGSAELQLQFHIVCREWKLAPSRDHRLLTITLLNNKKASVEQLDAQCLFQAGLRVRGLRDAPWIDAYPENLVADFHDERPLADENVNRVLYRANRTFAVGHGCAADWVEGTPAKIASVWSDVLPVFETPATSADLYVQGTDGTSVPLRANMRHLGGLDPRNDGLGDIERLLTEYQRWIETLERSVYAISATDRPTATALIERCQLCAARIADGLALLREDSVGASRVQKAFALANHAMLLAQLRGRQKLRLPVRGEASRLSWDPPLAEIDLMDDSSKLGYWRPFQIAFLLMSLRGIYDSSHSDRLAVDLIWFPTGGGKTEAYLGLTAFTVFYNALSKLGTSGVDVLMRYTLRLLTAQQFQRAATLFCAMDHLRCKDIDALGSRPFRIGLWVGGSTTPNKRADALAKLTALRNDPDADNPYVLLRCPWCGAKFGPHESSSRELRGQNRRRGPGGGATVYGYSRESLLGEQTVVYRCGDELCEFGGIAGSGRRPLPIVVIDEDLLEYPPNLLIGTVDKFAMLAWTPAAKSIFGIDQTGHHKGAPPTLIIQDELHLISGPLGSMVGAYETVIEALCLDPLGGMVRPKIVASTATISRAREQVLALYARSDVMLFPPSGLDASDAFFAREAIDTNGIPLPGRLYAGVLAPAHGSVQTSEARVFATLMQHSSLLEGGASAIDPWWTLLVFFNSLRELGGAATLFTADAREYLKVILNRHGIGYGKIRQLFHVEELTSRIRGDHIPKVLENLEVPLTEQGEGTRSGASPIDACLASSIIEVGVDIPRLSLMAIVGQPKTTSQYIQVSSRVGRSAEKPGLVVVVYGQTKARDRSHYEKFRAYHQQLYANVEPTSVTPFSAPAVDRTLHSLIVALVRQLSATNGPGLTPDPFPLTTDSDLRARIENIILDRVRQIAPHEVPLVTLKIRQRLDQWAAWRPTSYGGFGAVPEDPPLMHPAGSAEPAHWDGHSWPTMSSLRNVDASCEADLTTWYNNVAGEVQ